MITIIQTGSLDHVERESEWGLQEGMTLRQALKQIRDFDWGNIGGCSNIELSDGTVLDVDLTPAEGGGWLTNSQRVRRHTADFEDKTIRTYKI